MTVYDESTALVPHTPQAATIVLSTAEVVHQIEAIRDMQRSAMTEGTDYGVIPGTDRPTLLKPGAELLLKVHGFGHRLTPVETAYEDERRLGITYRCTVFRTLPDGTEAVIATCDGYAGYDETRFYQSAAALEHRERSNAERYKRQANPSKWAEEYRAPWNSVMKMAEKRALVGATLQACAASGLFTQDVEDFAPQSPPPWWETLGYASEEAAKGANDTAKELLDAIPQEHRDPIREWLKDRGYSKYLPISAADIAAYAALLRAIGNQVVPDEQPDQVSRARDTEDIEDQVSRARDTDEASHDEGLALAGRALLLQVQAMKKPDVVDALKQRGLAAEGTLEACRERLAGALLQERMSENPDDSGVF